MGQEVMMDDSRRLYEAAIAFKRLACWNWMDNGDYFAITDPETGELGFCVILGAGGIDYGLNVYLGEAGARYLQGVMRNQSGDDIELMHSVKAIVVNFEDREQLAKSDLDLIRELGYKFRGRREWPMFCSYDPGLVPWNLNGQQVRFLTLALEQACLVGERFRYDREMYFDHDQQDEGFGEKRLHRVLTITTAGIEWEDQWLPWVVHTDGPQLYIYPDEVGIRQLKKKMKPSKEIWECDYDYAPVSIGARGQRGIYPRLCLWLNHEGIIMNAGIVENSNCQAEFVEQLMMLIEGEGRKPARIDVGSEKALAALKDTADKLGIPIRYNPMSHQLLHAKDSISGML